VLELGGFPGRFQSTLKYFFAESALDATPRFAYMLVGWLLIVASEMWRLEAFGLLLIALATSNKTSSSRIADPERQQEPAPEGRGEVKRSLEIPKGKVATSRISTTSEGH
jgi:hypothetical protein